MPLEDLQRAIDASIANASALTRSIFETNHWDAAQVQDYVNQQEGLTVATTGRDGKPHASVVIASCIDGVMYFTASPGSAMLGNLRRDASIAFTAGDRIMGRGVARLEGRGYELKALAPQAGKLLRSLLDEDWPGYIYAIEVERLFAKES